MDTIPMAQNIGQSCGQQGEEGTAEFANLRERLLACADQFIAEWLPKILAEDVSAVVEGISRRRRMPGDAAEEYRKQVGQIGADEIAKRFRELVWSGCRTDGRTTIGFQRALRLPDDGKDYPLPPGLGSFPNVRQGV
jgi:hypothetical protein